MSDNDTAFKTVMRGYEPAEVDRRVAELNHAVSSGQQHAAELQRQIHQLRGAAESAKAQAAAAATKVSEPSYSAFGDRIGQILALAEEEAAALRVNAANQVKADHAEMEASIHRTRVDAERYAADTRVGVEREAARIIEEAKRTAAQMLDEADRYSGARREEAEAVYEQQRAQAAQAATDFEQTLASRRDKAEVEFQQRTNQNESQLKAAQDHIGQLHLEADRTSAESSRKTSALIAEAEQKADQIVAEAKSRADRIRSESERELAAATQRRDSINAQLTNVRQMLSTLSGTTPVQLAEVDHAEPAQEHHG